MSGATARVSKNTTLLLLGTVSRMVFSFFFVIYVARYLGVTGFGQYALALRYYELFLSISATGLTILLTREIARDPSRLNRYLTASVVLVTALAVVGVGLLTLLGRLFGYAIDTQVAISVAALALVPSAINLVLEAIFVAFEKAQYVTYGTILESLVRTGLGVVVLWLGYRLVALFGTLIAAQAVLLIYYYVVLRRRSEDWQDTERTLPSLRWHFEWPFFKQMLLDWRVFAAENWLSNFYSSLGLIFLSIFHGETVVGLYAAASKVLRLGTIVAKSYTTAVFPYLSRLSHDSGDIFRRLSEGSLKFMLALILPVVLTLSLLAEQIIGFLYTDEFAPAVPILQVLAWVLLFNFFNPYLSHILFARGDQVNSLRVAAFKLAFYVMVALALIPPFSALGTAGARLLSSAFAFAAYFYYVMKDHGLRRNLIAFGHATPAALGLGLLFWLLPNAHPLPLVLAGALLYIVLLYVSGIVTRRDLELFKRLK